MAQAMTRRLARTIVFAHTKYSSSLGSYQNEDVHISFGLVCKYEENIENGKTGAKISLSQHPKAKFCATAWLFICVN